MLQTRLKINGDNTTQPLISKDNKLFLIINGEIFNWHKLEKHLDYKCTMSDCEIIFPLYEKYKNKNFTVLGVSLDDDKASFVFRMNVLFGA